MALDPRTSVFGNAGARTGTAAAQIDEGLRAYMLRVYNYMGSGLLLSGIVAFLVYSSPAVFQAIFGSGMGMLVIWSPLILLLVMSFGFNKLSPFALSALYWAFCALNGISMSALLAIYTDDSVVRVFFITAVTFGAMSLYGYTTKKDLSGLGSFLFMGVIGLLIAMVVNIFLQSSAMQFVISVIGVLVFTGLTAFDTQRIKNDFIEYRMEGGLATKTAVMGAVSLYILFINIFQFLLMLLGNRE